MVSHRLQELAVAVVFARTSPTLLSTFSLHNTLSHYPPSHTPNHQIAPSVYCVRVNCDVQKYSDKHYVFMLYILISQIPMPATLSISSPECGATYECQNHKCLQYFQRVCVFPPVTLITRDLASPVQTHTPFLHRFLLCLYAQITGILQPVQTIQIVCVCVCVCVCACVHNSLRLMYTRSGEEHGVGYTHKLTDTTNKYMEAALQSAPLYSQVSSL